MCKCHECGCIIEEANLEAFEMTGNLYCEDCAYITLEEFDDFIDPEEDF